MMAEVKFRAWDKKERKMYYPENDKCENAGMNRDGTYGKYLRIPDLEIFETTQYIGLKDEAGKEKYQGDINRISWCNGFSWGTGFILGTIEQVRAAWGLKVIDGANIKKDFYTFYELDGRPDADRIIGNIYENPELAK